MPTSRDLLERLVAFDTTSHRSNLPLIDFVVGYLSDHGLECTLQRDETGLKANLWCTIGPSGQDGGIILSGHTDTVPVDGQDWSSDPFTLSERGGRLYARGACDMKGFLACVLSAVPKMLAAPQRRPFHIAFTHDEEVGCIGARQLVEKLVAETVRPAFCVVGEPTMMGVVTGHKAKRSMRVTVHGRSCHSSLAPKGVNAIDHAASLILALRAMGRQLATLPGDPAYDIAVTTAHTGTIEGGTVLNIVPNRCSFTCEFRVLPDQDPDALVAELRQAIASEEAAMRRLAPEARIELDVYAGFPGLDTPDDAEIVRLAKGWSQSNGQSKVAYGTEAGLFANGLGTATIVCGPGSIDVAHRPDEYVEIAQLDRCDAFLERLIAWNGA